MSYIWQTKPCFIKSDIVTFTFIFNVARKIVSSNCLKTLTMCNVLGDDWLESGNRFCCYSVRIVISAWK